MLSERFQILLSSHHVKILKQEAGRTGRSVSELIRAAIESTYDRIPGSEALRAVEEISQLNLPVADWSELKAEIDRSFGQCGP